MQFTPAIHDIINIDPYIILRGNDYKQFLHKNRIHSFVGYMNPRFKAVRIGYK